MKYDEQYVKDLERTIERQQEAVDKYSDLIKRLDGLNIKMSMQDCSQFIKPEAFVKWLENNSKWKVTSVNEDASGITKRFEYQGNERSFVIRTKCLYKSLQSAYFMDITMAFHTVWDMWMMEHKGRIITLIIEIMEFED